MSDRATYCAACSGHGTSVHDPGCSHTGHAAIVREALEYAKQVWDNTDDDRYCDTALAALAALEQELAEAKAKSRIDEQQCDDMTEAAMTAEAALAREKRASDVESEMLTLRYQAAEATLAEAKRELAVAEHGAGQMKRLALISENGRIAAEAERDKLREALIEVVTVAVTSQECRDIARAALAEDTP